jgi:hypothetical protein
MKNPTIELYDPVMETTSRYDLLDVKIGFMPKTEDVSIYLAAIDNRQLYLIIRELINQLLRRLADKSGMEAAVNCADSLIGNLANWRDK